MTSVSRKLMGCFVAVAAISLLVPLFYFRIELQRDIEEDAVNAAFLQAETMASMLESSGDASGLFANMSSLAKKYNIRFTLIDAGGEVVFDSSPQIEETGEMDNHLNRPEIIKAMEKGRGAFTRHSNTTDNELVYAVLRLDDGRFLRLAVPYGSLDGIIYSRLSSVVAVALAALTLSLLVAYLFSWRMRKGINDMVEVVDSIAQGNYTRRLHHVSVKEFSVLATAVNTLSGNIERQVQRVADRNLQLESILNTVPDGVLVLDAQGHIRSYNPALVKLFPEFKNSTGRFLPEVLAVYELAERIQELLSGRQKGIVLNSFELERPTGRFLMVRLASPAQIMRENSHYSLGAVVVFTDITQIVRLERTRRDFVANVSHELRTPLTAIQGYAETLGKLIGNKDKMPEQKRFASVIERQAARLGRLVGDLLTLSRLESGAPRPQGVSCNAAGVAADVVQFCAQAAENKDVNIELEADENLELPIGCDHLFQVLENLLDNAIAAANSGGRVCVKVHKDGGLGVISVADTGIGIHPDDQPRIFERFYKPVARNLQFRASVKADNFKQSATQGGGNEISQKSAGSMGGVQAGMQSTGLGLAICKHIVEFYGGNIGVQSPAGEFSTEFTIKLKAL